MMCKKSFSDDIQKEGAGGAWPQKDLESCVDDIALALVWCEWSCCLALLYAVRVYMSVLNCCIDLETAQRT